MPRRPPPQPGRLDPVFGGRPSQASRTFLGPPNLWSAGAVVFLCILAGGLIYLRQFRDDLRHDAGRELGAVADLDLRLVAYWRQERLSDGESLFAHPLVALAASRAPGSESAREELRSWCRSRLQRGEYRAVAIFDAGGELLASAGPPPERVHVPEMMRAREVVLSDLHEDATGTAHADLFVPLFLRGPAGSRRVGLVMMRAEPEDLLFPLIRAWPTPSRTGEVQLARRDGDKVQLLFASLGSREPQPNLRDLPAARAARGEEGLLEGVDYRGRRVLAWARAVPGTSWSLLAKLDEDEIVGAPLRERVPWLVSLGVAILASAVMGMLLLRRGQLDALRLCGREAESRRLALERHFAALTRYTNDILLLADGDLRIVDANDRAVSAYGYPREELLGKRLHDILAPPARAGLEARLRAIAAGQGEVFESVHLRRDGTTFPIEASSRIIEVEGERYTQSVIRDVTERRRAELALRRSEERLQLALEANDLGIWDWDVRRDELYLSPTLVKLLGDSPEQSSGGEAIHRLLRAEDHGAWSAGWQSLLDGSASLFEAEVKIPARSGEWKWVLGRSKVVERDKAGRPVRLVGTLTDISVKKQEQGDLARAGSTVAL